MSSAGTEPVGIETYLFKGKTRSVKDTRELNDLMDDVSYSTDAGYVRAVSEMGSSHFMFVAQRNGCGEPAEMGDFVFEVIRCVEDYKWIEEFEPVSARFDDVSFDFQKMRCVPETRFYDTSHYASKNPERIETI